MKIITIVALLMVGMYARAQHTLTPSPQFIHPWQGKRIAYFGDSISDPNNKAASIHFWQLLADWLQTTPCVYAVSGRQWNDIPRQADKLYKEHKDSIDAIIIFIGTNDYNNGLPLGKWYDEKEELVDYAHGKEKTKILRRRQYKAMTDSTFRGRINIAMNKVKRMYPTKQIVVLTPIHRAQFHRSNTNWQTPEDYTNQCGLYLQDYITATKEIANEWAVPVIDLNALCGLYPLHDEHAQYFNDANTDRLHPNNFGHERIALTLFYQLATLP